MENWFNYKLKLVASLSILYFLSSALLWQKQEKKWGFFGHQRINRVAVFTLPPEMFGFYKEHIEYLTEHAVDPDKRRYAVTGEAECHYIDIDHYALNGENPFDVVPRTWKSAVEIFTEDTLRAYGIVPWHIQVVRYKLQRAFEEKNVDLILKYSADLGHYIADAHVPLHTTENYNGQLTGQYGIHGLWESRLVEINAENYDYFVGKGKYIQNPLSFTWDIIFHSHQAVDSVLRFEKELTSTFPADQKYVFEQRGRVTMKTYSKEFSKEYHTLLNGMVERRLREAVLSIGSLWYTAWVDAGQPDLNSLKHKKPSAELLKEMVDLDAQFESGKSKGRECDH